MRNISIIIGMVVFVLLSSCSKSDDTQMQNNQNTHRVKRIVTTDKSGVKSQSLFYYSASSGKLDSVWVCDMNDDILKRDTIGRYTSYIYGNELTFTVYQFVLRIDAAAVEEIKQKYPEHYADTLRQKRGATSLYSFVTDVRATRTKEVATTFIERVDKGSGRDFVYTNLKDFRLTNLIERDPSGRVTIVRQFRDQYALDRSNSSFTTKIQKLEYGYSDNRIVTVGVYEPIVAGSKGTESWHEIDRYQYEYSNATLMRVKSQNFELVRDNRRVTVTESALKTIYELNAEDYPIKITFPDGSYSEIEYESGHGNFSEISLSTTHKMLGIPYIR